MMLKSKASMKSQSNYLKSQLGSGSLARITARARFSENENLGSASITKSLGSALKSSARFTSLAYTIDTTMVIVLYSSNGGSGGASGSGDGGRDNLGAAHQSVQPVDTVQVELVG